MPDRQRHRTGRLCTVLAGGVAGVLGAAGFRPTVADAEPGHGQDRRFTLTVMGTTDLHGNVFNWD